MAKAFCVSAVSNGVPDFSGLPCSGNVLLAITPNRAWGLYIVTGTGGQLTAINALPTVYALCLVTAGGSHWPELEDVISAGVRTRFNQWLTNRGYPTIPAGWTYRQTITAVCVRLNPNHRNIEDNDVLELE